MFIVFCGLTQGVDAGPWDTLVRALLWDFPESPRTTHTHTMQITCTTHTHTHTMHITCTTHTHTLVIDLLTHSLTHPPAHSLTHPPTHSLTLTLSHSLTHSHTHSLTHSLTSPDVMYKVNQTNDTSYGLSHPCSEACGCSSLSMLVRDRVWNEFVWQITPNKLEGGQDRPLSSPETAFGGDFLCVYWVWRSAHILPMLVP